MTFRALDADLFGDTPEIRRFNRRFLLFVTPLVVLAEVGSGVLRAFRVPFLRGGRPCA